MVLPNKTEQQEKSFIGFTENDVNTSVMNKRLWKIEDENAKLREEVRGLMDTERQWRNERLDSGELMKVTSDLVEMRRSEKVREQENKKLREEVEKIVALNQDYYKENMHYPHIPRLLCWGSII